VSEFTYHLVIGLGEIGQPLLRVINMFGDRVIAHGRDLAPRPQEWQYHTIHICFPWGDEFVEQVAGYIGQYRPDLCMIHSTVVPGITDLIADRASCMVAYSPVRGRHGQMERDLLKYRKFVASPSETGLTVAAGTLAACGLEVQAMSPPVALELAKLLETTYSGLLIAWAQEMARFAETLGTDYWTVAPFLAEPPHLPRVAFVPGHIGGHCIMQNLGLLEEVKPSAFVDSIRLSNADVPEGDGKRLWPVPVDELLPKQGGCACQNHECC